MTLQGKRLVYFISVQLDARNISLTSTSSGSRTLSNSSSSSHDSGGSGGVSSTIITA